MAKTLCELKDLLKRDIKSFVPLTRDPTHICRKCGRVANSKKLLCKAVRLEKLASVDQGNA